MEVTCPKCSSRFNLPDTVAKPGAKLRCSVCKEIFRLDDNTKSADVSSDFNIDFTEKLSMGDQKKRKHGRSIVLALLFLCLLGGSGGAWWYFKIFLPSQQVAVPEISLEKKVEMLTMRNVRQYYVNNEKIGQIFVIEGKVVNEFPEPKELIEVEATLYGMDKKALVSKKHLAGTALSLFQLQVLGEKELEAFLGNKIEILSNNTNVPTGGEVPFMVLFYTPPQGIAEFGVRIIDVKDIAKKEE
ncbi:MAG: zinc-ribbon and DUF3426 domain-containing protein [Desulfovibrionaceae bacterium]